MVATYRVRSSKIDCQRSLKTSADPVLAQQRAENFLLRNEKLWVAEVRWLRSLLLGGTSKLPTL
jgi:hypothetical protein